MYCEKDKLKTVGNVHQLAARVHSTGRGEAGGDHKAAILGFAVTQNKVANKCPVTQVKKVVAETSTDSGHSLATTSDDLHRTKFSRRTRV